METIKVKAKFIDCEIKEVRSSKNSRFHAIRVDNLIHDPLRPGNTRRKDWDYPTGVWGGVFIERRTRPVTFNMWE